MKTTKTNVESRKSRTPKVMKNFSVVVKEYKNYKTIQVNENQIDVDIFFNIDNEYINVLRILATTVNELPEEMGLQVFVHKNLLDFGIKEIQDPDSGIITFSKIKKESGKENGKESGEENEN